MKQIFSISSVYIGLVIGAGFASGREIFEYFNIPSQANVGGVVLSTIWFGIISYVIMTLAKTLQSNTFDQFIERVSGKAAVLTKLFMYSFMFCGFFVMLAASGTLFQDTLNLPFGTGVLILAVVCFAVFAFDLRGIVAINSILVPFMLAGMTVLCISSLLIGVPAFSAFEIIKNNIFVSGLCYVSYNTITAGAVLVPLSARQTHRCILRSAILASAILGLLIFVVWLTLNLFYNNIYSAEMPLLTLAAFHGDTYKNLYAIILFMALCTTAISHGFGILSKFQFKKTSDRIIAAAVLCLVAMPFAKFGFSTLIAKLYSVFGYLGLIWTGMVIYKFLKT